MALIISDDILSKAQLSAEELLVDLACYLYYKKRMSMGKAKELTGLNQLEFQQKLAARSIDIHYTQEDLENLGIEL